MKITLITAICFAFGSAGMAQPKPPKANKPPTPNKPGVAKPGSERPSGPTIVKKPSKAVHLLQALDGNEDGKLSFQEIDRVIIGVDNVNQLREIINKSQSQIPDLDWSFMISDDKKLIDPTNWNKL